MSSFKEPLAAVVLAAMSFAAPTYAGSITGDSFTATMSDDSQGPIELDGSTLPVSGTAGDPGLDLLTDRLEIDWVDDNSFDLTVIYGVDLVNLTISIADLNFKDGSNPVAITGVTFNDAETDQEDYNGFEAIVGPSVSFTANSIEVSFASFPFNVAADGIQWRFDVATSGGSSAVPDALPASVMWAAFGGLVLANRRWQKR